MTTEAKGPRTRDAEPVFGPGRRAWAALLLAAIAFLAAIDRNILALLLVPIQTDLKVSDAAMGALSGTAFAVVYATSALPLAWLADRTNRRNFLAAAVAFWSVMTALCGAAGTYFQLLLARFGVAFGEAAHLPTSLSLVADIFPAKRRATAVSLMTVGTALGFSVGAYMAGVLNDHLGWKGALMAVGAPGLVLAVLLYFTLPEPPRGAGHAGGAEKPLSMIAGLKALFRVPSFLPLMLAVVCLNVAYMGWLYWLPAFLMRVHGLSATNMSAVFGGVAFGGVIANLVAGVASDALAKRGAQWRMYYGIAMCLVGAPILAAALLVPSMTWTFVLMGVYAMCTGGMTTISNAGAISIVPPHLRATVVAVIYFAAQVFGGGIAPPIIGFVNDALAPTLGTSAVRYTLLSAPVFFVLTAMCLAWVSRTMAADVAAAEGDQAAPQPAA